MTVALATTVTAGYYSQILFGGEISQAAVATQYADYNGPSVAERIITTQIGFKLYRFPRNLIIGNLNDLRLSLGISSLGGVNPDDIERFERWGGGNGVTPSLVEAEVTVGSPSQSMADYHRTLKDKYPVASLYGLLEYPFSPEILSYLPADGEPTSIFCFNSVGNCQKIFDVSGGNGVLVTFGLSRLPDWQAIRSFVRDVVEKHGSDLE